MKWANEKRSLKIELSILGYSGKHSKCFTSEDILYIQKSENIKTTPKFKTLSNDELCLLERSHIYVTFTYRDSCPNTVVESMAYGLPVLAVRSGGLPDIVGNAGILISNSDFELGFHSSHRYECDFPPIDFDEVLSGIFQIVDKHNYYKSLVLNRFSNELSIKQVALRYENILKSLL